MILLVSGMVYAWSVFSSSIAEEFSAWSKATLSITFTTVMIFFCLGGLVGGFLSKKIKPSFYIWASAVLFFLGFMLSSACQNAIMLYIGFGVLCGFASGLSYNGVISSISKWFPSHQGLISGILLMGFGLSSFIVGKLFQVLTEMLSWRAIFKIFGIFSLLLFALLGFFIKKPQENVCSPSKVNKETRDCSTREMMKKPEFYLYFIWAFVMSASGLALVSQASGLVVATTVLAPSMVATLVGVISIFNGVGRVLIGSVYDKKGSRTVLYLIDVLFIITGVILCIALKCKSPIILCLGFMIGGIAYGGVTCTNAAYIGEVFGQKYYPENYSVINMNLLIASFGSTIAGFLLDKTNSYLSIVFLILSLSFIGLFLSILVLRKKSKHLSL